MATTHFTYGANHLGGKGFNKFTTIVGVDSEAARDIEIALHGREWAFDYPDDDRWAGIVQKHGLTCIETVTVTQEETV